MISMKTIQRIKFKILLRPFLPKILNF